MDLSSMRSGFVRLSVPTYRWSGSFIQYNILQLHPETRNSLSRLSSQKFQISMSTFRQPSPIRNAVEQSRHYQTSPRFFFRAAQICIPKRGSYIVPCRDSRNPAEAYVVKLKVPNWICREAIDINDQALHHLAFRHTWVNRKQLLKNKETASLNRDLLRCSWRRFRVCFVKHFPWSNTG